MNRKWIFALFVSTVLLLGQFCVLPAYALAYHTTNLHDLFVGQVIKPEYIKQLAMTPEQQTKTRKIGKDTINNVMAVLPPAQRSAWKKMLSAHVPNPPNSKYVPPLPPTLTAKQKSAMKAIQDKKNKRYYDILTNTKRSESLKSHLTQIMMQEEKKAREAVYTPAQQAQFKKIRIWHATHYDCFAGFREFNFPLERLKKITIIYLQAQVNLRAILTKAQQMKLDDIIWKTEQDHYRSMLKTHEERAQHDALVLKAWNTRHPGASFPSKGQGHK